MVLKVEPSQVVGDRIEFVCVNLLGVNSDLSDVIVPCCAGSGTGSDSYGSGGQNQGTCFLSYGSSRCLPLFCTCTCVGDGLAYMPCHLQCDSSEYTSWTRQLYCFMGIWMCHAAGMTGGQGGQSGMGGGSDYGSGGQGGGMGGQSGGMGSDSYGSEGQGGGMGGDSYTSGGQSSGMGGDSYGSGGQSGGLGGQSAGVGGGSGMSGGRSGGDSGYDQSGEMGQGGGYDQGTGGQGGMSGGGSDNYNTGMCRFVHAYVCTMTCICVLHSLFKVPIYLLICFAVHSLSVSVDLCKCLYCGVSKAYISERLPLQLFAWRNPSCLHNSFSNNYRESDQVS